MLKFNFDYFEKNELPFILDSFQTIWKILLERLNVQIWNCYKSFLFLPQEYELFTFSMNSVLDAFNIFYWLLKYKRFELKSYAYNSLIHVFITIFKMFNLFFTNKNRNSFRKTPTKRTGHLTDDHSSSSERRKFF